MTEILAQNSDFQPYFCAQLGISPRAYPQTYLMLKMSARIGELVMVHLKAVHGYVRPSQIYPRRCYGWNVSPMLSILRRKRLGTNPIMRTPITCTVQPCSI